MCMEQVLIAVENVWQKKARALDRYRWRLLRERHGRLGSALRFIRDALGDLMFGVRAWFRLAHEIKKSPCDFLLLQSAPKVIKFQRKRLLVEGLRARGHDLRETALQSPKLILRERQLKQPPQRVPLRYFGYAAHAEWLVEHHQPKIVLNDRNGSLYSPFLRLALNYRDRLLVHLAHATTVESSQRLSMNDYDYYLLFGRSSSEALLARRLRFGSSVAVLTGSHMIDSAYDLPPADSTLRTLLVLGVGPDKEKQPAYQSTYLLLLEWARKNQNYRILIKAHPRSELLFWVGACHRPENIVILPRECSLVEALAQASIVINIMSNAVIEAALARRPLLYVNASGEQDIFSQERYLGGRIATLEELQRAVSLLQDDFSGAVERAQGLAEYHLANGFNGLVSTLDVLDDLYWRRPLSQTSLFISSSGV